VELSPAAMESQDRVLFLGGRAFGVFYYFENIVKLDIVLWCSITHRVVDDNELDVVTERSHGRFDFVPCSKSPTFAYRFSHV